MATKIICDICAGPVSLKTLNEKVEVGGAQLDLTVQVIGVAGSDIYDICPDCKLAAIRKAFPEPPKEDGSVKVGAFIPKEPLP